MVLSILSAVSVWLTLVLVSLGGYWADSIYSSQKLVDSWSAEQGAECLVHATSNSNTLKVGYFNCANKPAASANLAILLMGGLLFLVAILSASFACCTTCSCCGARSDDAVIPMTQPMQAQVR